MINNFKVSFLHNGQKAEIIKGIDFKIPKDAIVGLVGESGSGKTVTALSILQLLDRKYLEISGSILWNEDGKSTDLLALKEDKIRPYRGAKIGMIFQEPMSALNPLLKCGFQVSEGLRAHQFGTKLQIRERVYECFNLVGLEDLDRIYNSYPFQLSGGQLQRVLIALAISCNPKLIIADEPTTALDVSLQRRILQLLKKLRNELGISILFISHDLNVVKELCDYAIVMQHGKVVEQGTIRQIFESPNHVYTKGLIYCRPPLNKKVKRLFTVQDFEKSETEENKGTNFSYVSPESLKYRYDELLSQKDLIQVENLEIEYPTDRNLFGGGKSTYKAVNNVSFGIKEGEILGLVGESGSGKTSIGKGILNLVPATGGSIRYQNLNLRTITPSEWRPLRKDLQIIFQDPYAALNPKQIIGRAIMEPMEVHKMYSNEKERKEQAFHLLETVGLHSDHFNRYPHQFSGGQRQRICIARALSLKPRFIVCDEPVSSLDVSIQAQILNLLQELKEKFGLSYLFITHDLSVVNFIADRIAVIKDGIIVEYGNCTDIINSPRHEYTQMLLNSAPDLI